MTARIVTVGNLKGGTAKTTTAVSLATVLAQSGKKVLVLDLDAQGDATTCLGAESDDGEGIVNAITQLGSLIDAAKPSAVEGLEVVPAGYRLGALDRAIGNMEDEMAASTPGVLLREALSSVREVYDFIIADCPPTVSTIVRMGLMAATDVIVPMEPHGLGAKAVNSFSKVVRQAKARNPDLKHVRIVLCRVKGQTSLAQFIGDKVREAFGDEVCATHIRETVRISEAPMMGKPVLLTDPKGAGAQDYRDLADELFSEPIEATEGEGVA